MLTFADFVWFGLFVVVIVSAVVIVVVVVDVLLVLLKFSILYSLLN